MSELITLIAPSRDLTRAHFAAFLRAQRVPFQLLPLERLYENGSIQVGFDSAVFAWDDQSLFLPSDSPPIYSRLVLPPNASPRARLLKSLLVGFLQRASGRLVNPPLAGDDNFSKGAQVLRARRAGADFPASLLTNHSPTVEKLARQHPLIYKSPSSMRSIVAAFDHEAAARLPYLKDSPVLFQERIPGDDLRVHVIGQRCFGERILSPAVDYRYDPAPEHVAHQPYDLPATLAELCVGLTAESGLAFSGIDFKLDPAGRACLLEINPMPGYHDYDQRADHAISQALLDYLLS